MSNYEVSNEQLCLDLNNTESISDILAKVSFGGKFFTVVFQKKDGTIRTMNGRLGVSKYLKGDANGKARAAAQAAKGNVCMRVPATKGYRQFNKGKVLEIRGCGQVWKFNHGVSL